MNPQYVYNFLCLFAALAVLVRTTAGLELYGCYLPDEDPSVGDIIAFQNCIEVVNGVEDAEGGRWGRSLEHVEALERSSDTAREQLTLELNELDSLENTIVGQKVNSRNEKESALLKAIGFYLRQYKSSKTHRTWTSSYK